MARKHCYNIKTTGIVTDYNNKARAIHRLIAKYGFEYDDIVVSKLDCSRYEIIATRISRP